jgi:hypothetical protein
MYSNDNKLVLQYFAEGSAPAGDGAGAATGESSAVPGQSVLEGLGVPADRAKKWASSKVRVDMPTQQQAEAQTTEQGTATPAVSKASFDEMLTDPEYKQAFDTKVHGILQSRLAKLSPAKEAMDTMQDAMAALAVKYNIDPYAEDFHKTLSAAIMADDGTLERFADERGTSIETARKDFADKLELERLRNQNRITMNQQTVQNHMQRLQEQAQEVLEFDPDFDLMREINTNAAFARMTSPQIGMSVADAYFATHRKDILAKRDQAQGKQAMQMASDYVRSGQSRPKENGATMPSSVAPVDYSKLPRAQQKEILKEMQRRAAQGERPRPSTILR